MSKEKTDLDNIVKSLQAAFASPYRQCNGYRIDAKDVPNINLYDFWKDLKQSQEISLSLSQVSTEYLSIKRETERRQTLKKSIHEALLSAVSTAGLGDVLKVETDFETRRKQGGLFGDEEEETLAADVAITDGTNPLIWCEVADGQSYNPVLDRMMHINASFRNVTKFVIVHVHSNSRAVVEPLQRYFSINIQLFERVTDMEQLGSGRLCTLKKYSTSRMFPYPVPGSRHLDQNFDLVLTALRGFECFEGSSCYYVCNESALQGQFDTGAGDVNLSIDVIGIMKPWLEDKVANKEIRTYPADWIPDEDEDEDDQKQVYLPFDMVCALAYVDSTGSSKKMNNRIE